MVEDDGKRRVVTIWMVFVVVVGSTDTTTTSSTTTSSTTSSTTTTKPAPLPPLPKKPHVVLMVADDLGWNDVSWNNPKVVTPHLGLLATEGVILNHSYVLPTCTPTRAALLTGRYPFKIGMNKGALDPLEPRGLPLKNKILPEALKKLGYSTHIIGKWHLGFCSWLYTPTKRGFDTFYGFYTGAEDYYSHTKAEKPIKRRKEKTKKGNRNKGALDLRNNTTPDATKQGIYSTLVFASAAEEILRSRNSEKPMFLYLPFQSVHAPLQVPKNYSRVFSHVGDYYRRNYLGMVMAMDEAVGRVVAALKDTGHYDNSIIIFTTDNGGSVKMGASNWPLRGGKSNLLEGGTRGPAFIHSPLLPNPGTVSNQLFHVTDWFSTIVALAGGKAPDALDSIDQWYALAGVSTAPRKRLVYNIDDSEGKKKFRAAIRLNEFKLSVGHVGKKRWAPYHPIRRLLAPEDISFVLPEIYNNDTGIMTASFNSSLIDIDNSKTSSEFSTTEVYFEEEGNSSFSRSSRISDPFTAVYSENSHARKMTQTKKKQVTKDPIKIIYKNKNKQSNLEPIKYLIRHKQQQNLQKPNKTNTRRNKKKPSTTKNKDKNYKKPPKKIKDKKKKNTGNKKKRPKKKKKPFKINQEDREWNRNSGSISWSRLKYHRHINWDTNVLRKLDRYLLDNTKIRLYNITADPGESTDLSRVELPMVQTTMNYLAEQLNRYVRMKPKTKSARGHPENWNNVWSPGWCVAK